MEESNKIESTGRKSKSLIDRFWWVIPPVFLTFVYWPVIRGAFFTFSRYVRALRYLVNDDGLPTFFWSYFTFGPMAVGMLLTRRRSFALRISVPIIFGILGSVIGMVYTVYKYGI